jgi:hypothetical protein
MIGIGSKSLPRLPPGWISDLADDRPPDTRRGPTQIRGRRLAPVSAAESEMRGKTPVEPAEG